MSQGDLEESDLTLFSRILGVLMSLKVLHRLELAPDAPFVPEEEEDTFCAVQSVIHLVVTNSRNGAFKDQSQTCLTPF